MLHLHRSNRLENLAGTLASLLGQPLGDPLAPELVVVQSLGLRRWLQHRLAEHLGVAMNIEFPFPAELLGRVCDTALGPSEKAALFTREVLPWRVLRELPALLASDDAETLAHYVAAEENPGLKQWQLAHRIAAAFDRYIGHRPKLLTRGRASEWPDTWQPRLWKRLTAGCAEASPPARIAALEKALESGRAISGLPERIAIFGISSLPPLFLRLVELLGQAREVHLFLLTPTQHYWSDLRSLKERDKLRAKGRDVSDLETGHPLLASLGKVGREFHDALLALDATDASEDYPEPGTGTLLHTLQQNMLDLESDPPTPPAAEDRSIQLHCCHGPMREVEVLHDQLLDLLQTLPGLEPRDILVAVPDAATYTPYIEAVFGSPETERVSIPFRIADRTARTESGLADAFLRLLEVAPGRFPAPAVLDLLEVPAIHQRFGLAAADLARIQHWVKSAAIRWGIDAAHREREGLPPLPQNTWRAGLSRLLLGYALGGERDDRLFDDVLPVREIEGADATLLGGFADFCEHLFAFAEQIRRDRPPADWARLLRSALEDFFAASDDFATEYRQLSTAISAFAEAAAQADYQAPLGFDLVRSHFAGILEDTDSGAGFLGGHVTFSALKPMRSIPFRVIALLGLGSADFPRRDTPAGFDLTALRPQPLDRTRRDDDRFLFLEMLVSARDTLYLSYPGLSPQTHKEEPPSVIVAELLDFLGKETAKRITTQHALQPFSPRYYEGGPTLFSYSAENCLPRVAPQPLTAFAATALPASEDDRPGLELDALIRFFQHPARYFLTQRLRWRLPEESEIPEESEPFSLDTLTAVRLQQIVAERALADPNPAAVRALLTASGQLPLGHEASAELARLEHEVSPLVAAMRAAAASGVQPPLAFAHPLPDGPLSIVLHGVYPTGCVLMRAWKTKAKDLLRAWLTHLAWNLAPDSPAPKVTRLLTTDGMLAFRPVEKPAVQLEQLAFLFTQGADLPLSFFPQTGLSYAKRLWRPGKERTTPLDAVRKEWLTDKHYERDAWNERCFGHLDDWLNEAWLATTTAIYEPLFAHLEGELP